MSRKLKKKLSYKALTNIELLGGLIGILGCGTALVEPGPDPVLGPVPGEWTPKWSVGQHLSSYAIPDWSCIVLSVNLPELSYGCSLTFAGQTWSDSIPASTLESSDIHAV